MVQVPILQDSLTEPTEQFNARLTLENDNGISVTVDPALATVNIINSDSELENLERERERERERETVCHGREVRV